MSLMTTALLACVQFSLSTQAKGFRCCTPSSTSCAFAMRCCSLDRGLNSLWKGAPPTLWGFCCERSWPQSLLISYLLKALGISLARRESICTRFKTTLLCDLVLTPWEGPALCGGALAPSLAILMGPVIPSGC